MAISLICDCGKKLAVKEEHAGKRVKCPACESLITVPSVLDEPPARQRAAAPVEDEEDMDEDRPRKKKKKKRAGKSNKMVWIGAGAGLLVLGLCCVGAAGGGLWFFLKAGPEKPILGKWGIDLELTKKNNPLMQNMFKGLPPQAIKMAEQKLAEEMAKVSIEIKRDGSFIITDPLKSETGKWKNAQAKGDVVTIEVKKDSGNDPWERLDFKVIDQGHLQFTPTKGFVGSMWLKRL
jgi:hypothetical protein